MATLTSSYQYLGRSSVMTSVSGSLSYYILLYGKTTANQTTGIHTVTIKEILASTSSNATYYYYTQAHNGTINGSTAFSGTNKPSTAWELSNFTAGGVTYKTGTLLGEGSVNVDATDGAAKNIPLSCYYAFNGTAASYTPAYGTSRTVSVTATLAAIPRATTPTLSASPYTIGTALTISLAPANSTFKHKISYDFGNLTGQTSGLSIGSNFTAQGNTTVTFTPPAVLGSQIMAATSGIGKIYCYTYTSSGTHIGTKTIDITINVPSYTPEINNVVLTGNNLLSGAYVQNKSTITVNASLKTYYSAGIKSVVIEVDGKSYTSLPVTSSVLSNGSKTVKITFTDTRGKSVTYTSSAFTVYPYTTPTITEFTLERQSDGTTVIATLKGNVAAINNLNTKAITVTLNGVTNTLTSSAYTISGTTTFTDVPTDNSFTATATIEDYYATITKSAVLPTIDVTMDFHYSGTGIAMGKVAEYEDTFDCDWNFRLQGEYVVDYEIYRGTSDGWTVKKYMSGEIEAYKSVSINTTVSTAYGNGYYNGTTLSVNLPSDFVNNAFPIININAQSTQAQIIDANIAAYNQAERKISYYISSPGNQATAYQIWVHFRVVGRWK